MILDTRCWMRDSRYAIRDVRCLIPDAGYRMREMGYGMRDTRCAIPDALGAICDLPAVGAWRCQAHNEKNRDSGYGIRDLGYEIK